MSPAINPTPLYTDMPSVMPIVSPTLSGSAPQLADFDSDFRAPRCETLGSSCDSGDTLLLGVGSLFQGGPEPNAPNTLDNCIDSYDSVFQRDESIDRLIVKSIDGGIMTAGRMIEVEATVSTAVNVTSREG